MTMRRWVVAVVLLVGCGSDGKDTVPEAERIERINILAPALLNRQVETTAAQVLPEMECAVDADRQVSAMTWEQRGGDVDTHLREEVAVALAVCPESDWDEIAATVAGYSGEPVSGVENLVELGRNALAL